MKTRGQNSGFTLIEMVVVVAIIAILISMVFGIATRVEEQGKIRLCKDTLAIIDNALEQFRDFGYEYKDGFSGIGLNFPLDCNDFSAANLESTLDVAIYQSAPVVDILQDWPIHDPNYSESEALYFILSQVPDCRATLEKIDKSLLSNKSKNGTAIDVRMTIGINISTKPFTRIIDPWGTTLRYDYYDDYIVQFPPGIYVPDSQTKKTFPVITSAGPDKKFGTKDDITNRQ
jgi:prepilin-type N-terminal cleavage/methylation domain-containing protein